MQRKDDMYTRISRIKRFGLMVGVVGALILVPSAASQSGPQYADGSGDAGGAGDLSGVTVLGDKSSGQYVFRIAGSNLSTAPNQLTFLYIDSDANPLTGSLNADGADYAFGVDDSSYDLAHWDGSDWVDTPSSTVRVCCVGGGTSLMISINRSELGNTSSLNFSADTWNTDTRSGDDAPDDGMFNYSLDAGGPDIQGMTLQTSPSSGPRAGRAFTVEPIGLKIPPNGALVSVQAKPESYSCRATLGSRTVAGHGVGGCTLRIPKKKAHGKKLHLLVTVTYEGATKSVPFTFVVS
jgi:hypothetical protein